MFSSDSKNKSTNEANSQQNVIAQGTKIVGDITSTSPFRIDGNVEGNIKTEGKVVIGKTGVVNGTLEGSNVDVEGLFSGKLLLSGTLTLKATAQIEGDVVISKLAVELGATFNATCTMNGGEKRTNNSNENQKNAKHQKETA